MHYPDLSPYDYCWPSAYEAAYCGLPVYNIGWLSGEHPFPTGDVPVEFPARLLALCAAQLCRNPGLHLMGYHNCEACPVQKSLPGYDSPGHERIYLGSDEIRIIGRDCAYAAPNMIYHYVTAHRYRPPDDFIGAVMNAPARETRSREMYAYHLWEAVLNPRVRGDFSYVRAFIGDLPGSRAGTTLGPLVRRFRLAQGAGCAGLGLILLVSKPTAAMLGLSWQPVLIAGALLGLAMLLAAAYWAEHLPCPFCHRVLRPARLPTKPDNRAQIRQGRQQEYDRSKLTEWLFCDSGHYAFEFRVSPFPWSAPPCHVWIE